MSDSDATLPPEEREKRALMLWPTSVLKHATKYVVAFRGVVNADGDLVEPSAGFAALRDGTPSSDPLIDLPHGRHRELLRRPLRVPGRRPAVLMRLAMSTMDDIGSNKSLNAHARRSPAYE